MNVAERKFENDSTNSDIVFCIFLKGLKIVRGQNKNV